MLFLSIPHLQPWNSATIDLITVSVVLTFPEFHFMKSYTVQYFQTFLKWWWFSCSVMSNSCSLMDYSPPGSSVHGISQARIVEWVAISFSQGSSQSGDQIYASCITGGFFTTEPPGNPHTGLDKSPKGSHLEGHQMNSSSILEMLTELMNSSSKGMCYSLFLIV